MENKDVVYDVIYKYSTGREEKIYSFANPNIAKEYIDKYIPKAFHKRYYVKEHEKEMVYSSLDEIKNKGKKVQNDNLSLKRLMGHKKIKKLSVSNYLKLTYPIKMLYIDSETKERQVVEKSSFTLQELKYIVKQIEHSQFSMSEGIQEVYSFAFQNNIAYVYHDQYEEIRKIVETISEQIEKLDEEILDLKDYFRDNN